MARLRQAASEDKRAERNEQRRLEQGQARRYTVIRRGASDRQRKQENRQRLFTSNLFLRLAFEYEPYI
jgi:hypothetical protein